MTALRIGRVWPRYHTFVDRAGRRIDMREICPKDVRDMAMLDSADAMWKLWTEQEQWRSLAPRPCLEPLVQLCAGTASRSSLARTVAHLATMGPVTQTVLYDWHKAEDSRCQSCLRRFQSATAAATCSLDPDGGRSQIWGGSSRNGPLRLPFFCIFFHSARA